MVLWICPALVGSLSPPQQKYSHEIKIELVWAKGLQVRSCSTGWPALNVGYTGSIGLTHMLAQVKIKYYYYYLTYTRFKNESDMSWSTQQILTGWDFGPLIIASLQPKSLGASNSSYISLTFLLQIPNASVTFPFSFNSNHPACTLLAFAHALQLSHVPLPNNPVHSSSTNVYKYQYTHLPLSHIQTPISHLLLNTSRFPKVF